MSRSSYVLVTTLQDEAHHLGGLVASVLAQEELPARWILVEGGSSDGSAELAERVAAEHGWVRVVSLARAGRDAGGDDGLRRARAASRGLRLALQVCDHEGLDAPLVAMVDADVRAGPAVLAELARRFERDRYLGIAGCTVRLSGRAGLAEVGHPEGFPRGGARMWRRECLQEVGLVACPNWSGTTALRARNRGWHVTTFKELSVEAVRPNAGRLGPWNGYRGIGRTAWHCGLHPLPLLVQATQIAVRGEDPVRGVALVAGWVEGALRRDARSRDPEVRAHYGTDLPREQLVRAVGRAASALPSTPAPLRRLLKRLGAAS